MLGQLMPYSYPDAIPQVAQNWKPDEQRKCAIAAQAVLDDNGTDEMATFACIHAAGKSKVAVELLNLAEDSDWEQPEEMSEPNGYLDKFKSLVLGLGYFTKEQVDGLIATARGYAGGKAQANNRIQSLEFEDFAPPKLRGLSDPSLILAHKRLHTAYDGAEDGDMARIEAAHTHIVGEMKRRGLSHFKRDELDGGDNAKSNAN